MDAAAGVTAASRIRRTRRELAAIAVGSSMLWGVAAGALAAAGAAAVGGGSRTAPFAVAVIGVAVTVMMLWRWRALRSPRAIALWLEERAPALQYSLVTQLEPAHAALAPVLERRAAEVDTSVTVRRAWRSHFVWPVATAAIALAAWIFAPIAAPAVRSAVRSATARGAPALPAPLADLTVTVRAPAYANARTRELRDPETIAGLPGSRVTVRGRTPASGVAAALGAATLDVRGARWSAEFTMPAQPVALRLVHAPSGGERVIVVAPVPDSTPRVRLLLPSRDTTYRVAPARIDVEAVFTDDIGLTSAAIEYMISSGQEETFTARTGVPARRTVRGERETRLRATLGAGALALKPGDVLSLRAVGRDGNVVGGPGAGVSETRTIRVARSDEYDSVAVEAAGPVFGDTAVLSQRMIIRLTEALVRESPGLTRDSLHTRSVFIAAEQERLRDRVHEIVYPGHSHEAETPMEGEPPDHAEPADPVNADLRIAYDAMWEAARELRIASPATALPPMRTALAALDRARLLNRYYLRSAPPRVVVDIGRVRLQGRDRGASTVRVPGGRDADVSAALAARVERAATSSAGRQQLANELALLRVEALRINARAAAALGSAVAALRAGRDPAPALAVARSELAGRPRVGGSPLWSGS